MRASIFRWMGQSWILVTPALVLISLGLYYWFAAASPLGHNVPVGRALVVAGVTLVAITGLLWLGSLANTNPARRRFGVMSVLLGADGRFSTSKTMVYLWTVLLAVMLAFLSELCWSGLTADQVFKGNWDAYFLLLGGPFASAVLAKGIVTAKVNADPTVKSSTAAGSATTIQSPVVTAANAPGGTTGAKDIVTNDAGEPDLVDTQYSIFTLVAVAYILGSFIANVHRFYFAVNPASIVFLPTVPSALLGLTSLAALTYVGSKAVQQAGGRFVSLEPNPANVGSPVTAAVINLGPAATVANTIVVASDATSGSTLQWAPTAVTQQPGTQVTNIVFVPIQVGRWMMSIVTPENTVSPLPLTVK